MLTARPSPTEASSNATSLRINHSGKDEDMQSVLNPPATDDEWFPNDEDSLEMNPPAVGSKRPRNNEEQPLLKPPTTAGKCPKEDTPPGMNCTDGLSAAHNKRPEILLHPLTFFFEIPVLTILGDAGDSSGTPSRGAVDLERPNSTAAVSLGEKKIIVDSNAESAKDSVGHEQRKVRNSLFLFYTRI